MALNVHWIELANLLPEQLAKVDLAAMNLICAHGLPGAEHLDVEFCLRQVDSLTERVRADTERSMYAFDRNPAKARILKVGRIGLSANQEVLTRVCFLGPAERDRV